MNNLEITSSTRTQVFNNLEICVPSGALFTLVFRQLQPGIFMGIYGRPNNDMILFPSIQRAIT